MHDKNLNLFQTQVRWKHADWTIGFLILRQIEASEIVGGTTINLQARKKYLDKIEIKVMNLKSDFTAGGMYLVRYELLQLWTHILFLEDLLLQHNTDAYRAMAEHTSIPPANSERWATRFDFREFIEADIGGIAMYDLTWCGSISEGKKIFDMADTHYLPAMMHTAGGSHTLVCFDSTGRSDIHSIFCRECLS